MRFDVFAVQQTVDSNPWLFSLQLEDYTQELKEMAKISKEEYLATLRRSVLSRHGLVNLKIQVRQKL